MTNEFNPKSIRLPNGQVYNIQDLVDRRRNYRSHNLLEPRRNRTIRTPKSLIDQRVSRLKYTLEDRIWLAQASQEDIALRYKISLKQASMMKYQSRYIIEQLDIDTDTDT